MKYTVDQLELIAIMFKTQFGEKTLDEVFKIQSSIYKGKIEDLKIKRCDTFKGDINFLVPTTMFKCSSNQKNYSYTAKV